MSIPNPKTTSSNKPHEFNDWGFLTQYKYRFDTKLRDSQKRLSRNKSAIFRGGGCCYAATHCSLLLRCWYAPPLNLHQRHATIPWCANSDDADDKSFDANRTSVIVYSWNSRWQLKNVHILYFGPFFFVLKVWKEKHSFG